MLRRCYAKEWLDKHPTYIGCYVCNRWLLFSNFIEDIKLLDNYDKWIENKERYELDKDIKSNGTNKCYCPESCISTIACDCSSSKLKRFSKAIFAVSVFSLSLIILITSSILLIAIINVIALKIACLFYKKTTLSKQIKQAIIIK